MIIFTFFKTTLPGSTYLVLDLHFYSAGCLTECGGSSSCLLPYNCTHFDQCHSTDMGCSCTRLMCSFGTFFSAESGVCDTVAKGLCDKGDNTKTDVNDYNDYEHDHDYDVIC